ncbi:PRLI-interacting factor [Abeliophyllum distichum]|uniref:PRLI-interacting factor n=1 Tax=Abeliophyllum distichum TaxID=126358 RepID=A0ABD1VTZ7_9LAMI
MNEQASTMMNSQSQLQQQQQQIMAMNQNQMMSMSQMNAQPQQQMMMNRSFGMWAPPMPQPQFQNPNTNLIGMKPPPSVTFNKSKKQLGLGPRSNWNGKKVGKPNDKRRKDQQLQQKPLMPGSSTGAPGSGINVISNSGNMNFNYNPPTLNELQHQNRLKARKFFPKKNFNKNNNMNLTMGSNNKRFAPFAPRNTTSFLIRAKKSGGIAPLVSPYPVTPAVLPTPIFSPSREVLVDMAKEEWGLDGYGSMKGLIRLRSPGHEMEAHEEDEDDEGGSSESDVEEHVEVERRLDHDLSRFEMIYNPNSVGGLEYHNVLENRVDDQDTHIAQMEEENMILKDRLFLMERELGDLRRRLQSLERQGHKVEGENNEEVVENESENESDSCGEETQSMEENNEELGEDNVEGDGSFKGNGEPNNNNESRSSSKVLCKMF